MFELLGKASGSRARLGRLTTLHGVVDTPVFMPVGTRGAVRTQTMAQLAALGPRLILANTYHLLVRPGKGLFERLGGIHRWIGWPHGVLTDSGGFQVFSLGAAISEQGAAFGTTLLTPERSISMQQAIGSDIMMVLDECIDARSPEHVARVAMDRTHRWADRSLAARNHSRQALFAIVQGACFPELRRESARVLGERPFDGYAIGGLAVGESRAEREDITELTAEQLPEDRPRYLMGVGTPLDILEGVHRGVDMFDCILPTAWAQHGRAFTSHGRIDLRRGIHKLSEQPLDAACDCEACAHHSRSYLHHLIKCEEPLGWQLIAQHNLRFYLNLLAEIRAQLAAGTFERFYAAKRGELADDDRDNPPRRPRARAGKPTTRGAFGIRVSSHGIASVEHLASGERMHSVNAPDEEAEAIYIRQSIAITEALSQARAHPLVVWDVGLGAAHNAMALVRALDGAPAHAQVELISFERDLDALRLALAHTGPFPHLRHPGPHLLVHHGRFERDRLRWRLVPGDVRDHLASEPAPDVVFYDPFSAKVDAPLWSLATFRLLRAHLTRPAELITYTSSTAIRSSMLAAGFLVARGAASGPKEETTIALTTAMPGHRLLGRDWLDRRARSTAPCAGDADPAEVERAIRAHPQFTL
jgi:queuine tRNA-ribosyltransferase